MARRNKQEQKPADREEIAAGLAASMPADRDGLLNEARAAVEALHAAVMACDDAAASNAGNRYEAAIWKLNGGTFFACMAEKTSAGRVIEDYCRAAPGQVPTWGQAGQFLIEVDGIRALVKFRNGFTFLTAHYEYLAVDLDRPFISETGYRSVFEDAIGGKTPAEASAAIFAGLLSSERRKKIKGDDLERVQATPLPSWCSDLNPAPCRVPAPAQQQAAPSVPPGFVLVDVLLPVQKAYIARKWAEQAKPKIEAASAARLNAKGKGRAAKRPDPAPSKTTMSCSTVKNSDATPQAAAYWAGFKTGDRVRTKEVGTTGVFVLGDDNFIGYLVPDNLVSGPNPDAGIASLKSHSFSVTPNEIEHIPQVQSCIVRNDDAEAVPFVPGMRCEVVNVQHPCFSHYNGRRVILVKVHADTRQAWAHEDAPVTYRINRNGRRVVDRDPRCIQSIYSFDQLRPLTDQEEKYDSTNHATKYPR